MMLRSADATRTSQYSAIMGMRRGGARTALVVMAMPYDIADIDMAAGGRFAHRPYETSSRYSLLPAGTAFAPFFACTAPRAIGLDEGFGILTRLIVRHLHGRRLHEVGRRRGERPRQP